jgi:hypothetical protein
LDKTKGTLTGTPAASDVGTHACVVTATNGNKPDAAQGISIIVATAGAAPAPTGPPKISSALTAQATVGVPFSFHLSATGAPTVTISVPTATCASWLHFNGTDTLSGTPTTVGPAQCVLVAASTAAGMTPDTEQLTVTVNGPAPLHLLLNLTVQ